MNNPLLKLDGKSSFSGIFTKRKRVNPLREWIMGLSFTAIVVILGGSYALQIFIAGYNDKTGADTEVTDSVNYNERKVNEVLEIYKARKTNAQTFEAREAIAMPIIITETIPEEATDEETPVAEEPSVQVE